MSGEIRIEGLVDVATGLHHVQRVGHGLGIVALFSELALDHLEGARDIQACLQAQEDGPRVGGQFTVDEGREILEVERFHPRFQHQGRHAGAAVGIGDFHAVDVADLHLGMAIDDFAHFGGGDVL